MVCAFNLFSRLTTATSRPRPFSCCSLPPRCGTEVWLPVRGLKVGSALPFRDPLREARLGGC